MKDATKKDCLAVRLFLDNNEAFNCTTVETICRVAGRHDLEPTISRGIRNVLST